MIKFIKIGLCALLISSPVFARAPITLTGPSPAIPSRIAVGSSTTVTYTVTNNVSSKSFPLTVGGISGPITRTTVANDCGNRISAGPSTCNIGITITPDTADTSINQTLKVNYQGRTSLTSSINCLVPATFAYVTPVFNATSIDQFSLSSDGLLSTYTSAYTAMSAETFGQVAFAIAGGVQYAYILNPNGIVYWCNINEDGSFSNCMATTNTPPSGFWQARAITFATFNAQYAYLIDSDNNYVYQCAIDTTGDFSSCQAPYGLPSSASYGIAFATDGNGVQHGYLPDAGPGGLGSVGNVLVCNMLADGSFSSCIQTPASGAPADWIPYAVAFTTTNGVQYAYVADNGAGTGSPGHVYRCALNSDGSFQNSGCTPTPSNDASLSNWYPYYIAFQTVNGIKYAYVVNSSGSSIGNIYRCALDSNGFLTDCVLTPDTLPSSWQPSGIAFR